ncbi:hypothetical protein [Octadecabacter sp. R77987]|uniref:hypothetical protein n=1 Tax=Octadecabacter sp. R77987 TaxID=3093874 RepID=UPI00366B07F0
MDPISITFYAMVCGCLSMAAPRLGGLVPRLAVGAGIGVAAAILLPVLRGMMGLTY